MNPLFRLPAYLVFFIIAGCTDDSEPKVDSGSPAIANDFVANVASPPVALVERLSLDTNFYKQYVDADGIPVVASANVSPYALVEAQWIIENMLGERTDLAMALSTSDVRIPIIAIDELVTDIPEQSFLAPSNFWDKRVRGIHTVEGLPAASAGEEDILQLPSAPFSELDIFVHEFAHAIHIHGLNLMDNSFDEQLLGFYEQAMQQGLWEGTYSATNHREYFAVGVNAWFRRTLANDPQPDTINSREKLIAYDSGLAALLEQVLGDNQWRYQGPAERQTDKAHLSGYNPVDVGVFAWPERIADIDTTAVTNDDLNSNYLPDLLAEDWSNVVSPDLPARTDVRFLNLSNKTVRVRWINQVGDRVEQEGLLLKPNGVGSIEAGVGHLFEVIDNKTNELVAQFRAESVDSVAFIQ